MLCSGAGPGGHLSPGQALTGGAGSGPLAAAAPELGPSLTSLFAIPRARGGGAESGPSFGPGLCGLGFPVAADEAREGG
jgi:hypothetical protein